MGHDGLNESLRVLEYSVDAAPWDDAAGDPLASNSVLKGV